jgi:hypothetical protein
MNTGEHYLSLRSSVVDRRLTPDDGDENCDRACIPVRDEERRAVRSGVQMSDSEGIDCHPRRGTFLAPGASFDPRRVPREVLVTRTIGAAIGALIFVLFMAHIATSLASPVSASPTHIALSQR